MLVTATEFLWAAAFGTHESTTAKMAQGIREHQQAPDETNRPIRRALSTDTYDDGRSVATGLRYGEGEDDYVMYVWHPDPNHRDNRAPCLTRVLPRPRR